MSGEKTWFEKGLIAASAAALIWTPITCMRAVDIEDSAIRLEKELHPDSSSIIYKHLLDIKDSARCIQIIPLRKP